jgi:metacaspase-1
MRDILRQGKYTQIPQLSSSRPVDLRQPFYIVPPNCQGTRRAVLIGINYHGQNGELSGCHNDCLNIKKYIMKVWGFQEENVHVLMDDGQHLEPTKSNILGALKDIAAASEDGDAVSTNATTCVYVRMV